MALSKPKRPSSLDAPTKRPTMIGEIWQSGADAVNPVDPPKPNQAGSIPFTRLVYHIDDLNNLNRAIPVDPDVAGFIQKKSPAFDENRCTRELISLSLMGFKDVFTVHIWIIPVFMDGVMISQIYAADGDNQSLLLQHRNPTKPGDYDFAISD